MALLPENLHSFAKPGKLADVSYTHLELFVDFDRNILKGKATMTLDLECLCDGVVLDNYGLTIFSVTDYLTRKSLEYNITDCDDFGSKLTIKIPVFDKNGEYFRFTPTSSDRYTILIEYETSPNSPALYWLTREQTSDGTHPLLISNSKFTYARAIFPCQDTPSLKSLFYATISVPKGFNAMMAGHTKTMSHKGNRIIYEFVTKTKISPYEMFIIIGSLKEVKICLNSNSNFNLLAEEKYIQQGITALNKIKDVLLIVNELYGPLGKLNVCVLPPNIPEFDLQYSFMTFVSSTLLGGNYSLINTIVQNVLESWIGRLVKVENFQHLWLIKSFSIFIYRNIINNIVDKEMQQFLETKGINDMINMINLHGNVALVPNLTGVLLKNIIKYVPYEKGYLLLNYLQLSLGGHEVFKQFLQFYLQNCKSQSLYSNIKTNDFKTYLCGFFSNKIEILNPVDWNEWFYGLGLPLIHLYPVRRIDYHIKAEQWITEQTGENFSTIVELTVTNDLNKIEFLAYLLASPTVLPIDKLCILHNAIVDDLQQICEIRFLWLRLCIKSEWLKMACQALEFACEYCMPKYACPIFRDLYKWTMTRDMAVRAFNEKHLKMLPETIKELESILKVESNFIK